MCKNRNFALTALCSLAAAGLTSAAWAQAQPNQSQQQQVNPANATSTTPTTVYNGINQNPWFSSPTVRQQLQLTDEQYKQLNQGYGQSWTRYNQSITGLDTTLSEQQRLQRQQEMNGTFHRAFSDTTGRVFTEPAARQRYNQMYLQYQGYGAFNDPTVQQQLNLTPEQRQQFNRYDRNWNQQMNSWYPNYTTDPNAVNQQFANSRREFQQNVQSTLTPQQQQTWTELSGQPYNFTPDVYFQNGPVTNTTAKPVLK